MFGRRGVDVAPQSQVFRRQRSVFRDGVRGRGAGLSARRRRRLQGPEAGKPVARPSGLRETGQYIVNGDLSEEYSQEDVLGAPKEIIRGVQSIISKTKYTRASF